MTTITPNIWYAGDADEAAAAYTASFPDSHVVATTRYPTTGLPDFQADMAGKVLTIDVVVGGLPLTLVNADASFRPNPSISFMVNHDPSRDPDARDHLDALWDRLADGGRVLMELGEYPHSARYGWVEDRFGVSWQLILTNLEGEPRPFILPSFLFGGAAQNRAAEASAYYQDVLPGSRPGTTVTYREPHGPAVAGSVMFSDLVLAGTWVVMMDAAATQDHTFSEGVSLAVTAADQDEIDRLWAALSSDPAAEQCGWCKDRFGVSWQVVPENMGELMSHPGAYERLMAMGKIVVAEL